MQLPIIDNSNPPRKPELHVSQISMYLHCGQSYFWRYVEGKVLRPGIALITGTATHAAVEHNLKHKITTGQLLDEEEVAAIAADSVRQNWNKDGVFLTADERAEGANTLKGQAIDMAVRLSRLHHHHIAPQVEPTAVERTFKLVLPNYPVDLVGTIDVEEARGLRDNKTYKKIPAQDDVDRSIQLSMYGLAKRTLDGRNPEYLALDVMVKSKAPRVSILKTQRTDDDYRVLLRRVEVVSQAIEKGVFLPTVPDDWRCSEKWCGYFGICAYGARRRCSAALGV